MLEFGPALSDFLLTQRDFVLTHRGFVLPLGEFVLTQGIFFLPKGDFVMSHLAVSYDSYHLKLYRISQRWMNILKLNFKNSS